MKKTTIVKMAAVALAAAVLAVFAGCSGGKGAFMKDEDIKDIEKNPVATIKLNYGSGDKEMTFELYYKEAPITVTNFIALANDANKKYYDGLLCHRLATIDGVKILQGGAYDRYDDESNTANYFIPEELDYTIKGEFSNNGWTKNSGLKHERGTLAMARVAGNMDSAGSQFYINFGATPSLDGDYAVFGKILTGTQYFEEISAITTGTQMSGEEKLSDVPLTDIKIVSVSVNTFGVDFGQPLKIAK